MKNPSDATSARAGVAACTFFVAVAIADRLSALLNENVARKARRAGLTGRTSNYNAFRRSDSEFRRDLTWRGGSGECGSQPGSAHGVTRRLSACCSATVASLSSPAAAATAVWLWLE